MSSLKENIRYCLLQGFIIMIQCGSFVFSTFYLINIGASSTAVGTLTALSCIIAFILQPLSGKIADYSNKWNAKILLMIVIFIILGVSIFEFFCSVSSVCVVAFGVIQCCAMLSLHLANTISFYYEKLDVNINYGIARGTGSAAYTGISLLLGVLTVSFGYIVVPIVIIIISTLCFLLLFSMPSFREISQDELAQDKKKKTLSIREYKWFFLMIVGMVLVVLPHNMTYTYMLQIFENIGGNSGDVGVAVAIASATEIPLLFCYGLLRKKFSDSKLLVFSGFMFAVKFLLFIFAVNIYIIFAVQAIHFLGYGLYVGSRVYYAHAIVGESHEAAGQAYVVASETVAMVLGSFLGGVILSNFDVRFMLYIAFISALIGFIFMEISYIKGKNKS